MKKLFIKEHSMTCDEETTVDTNSELEEFHYCKVLHAVVWASWVKRSSLSLSLLSPQCNKYR